MIYVVGCQPDVLGLIIVVLSLDSMGMHMDGLNFTSLNKWVFVVFGLSFAFCASLILIFLYDIDLYQLIAKEGANAELLTAIFYLLSGIIVLYLCWQRFCRGESIRSILFFVMLGMFFLFVAGEEESWGQWIFSFNTPEYVREVNYQGEVNLHNMEFFKNFRGLLDPHRVLNALVVLFGIVVPLFNKIFTRFRDFLASINFPVCPVYSSIIFVFGIIYEKIGFTIMPHWAHTEISEFIFSISFLIFSLSFYIEYKNSY